MKRWHKAGSPAREKMGEGCPHIALHPSLFFILSPGTQFCISFLDSRGNMGGVTQ